MLISKCQEFYTKEQDDQRHLKLEDFLDPRICLATKKMNSLKPIEASNNRHNFLKNVTLNSYHEYFPIHRRSSHHPRDDATRNTLINKERKRKRDEQCRVRVIRSRKRGDRSRAYTRNPGVTRGREKRTRQRKKCKREHGNDRKKTRVSTS